MVKVTGHTSAQLFVYRLYGIQHYLSRKCEAINLVSNMLPFYSATIPDTLRENAVLQRYRELDRNFKSTEGDFSKKNISAMWKVKYSLVCATKKSISITLQYSLQIHVLIIYYYVNWKHDKDRGSWPLIFAKVSNYMKGFQRDFEFEELRTIHILLRKCCVVVQDR